MYLIYDKVGGLFAEKKKLIIFKITFEHFQPSLI